MPTPSPRPCAAANTTTNCSTPTTSRATPGQREHRSDHRPPHLPLRAQPAGGPHEGGRPGNGRRDFLNQWLLTLSTPSPPIRPPSTGTASGFPGGEVRHRDAVPAPGIRGVRADHPAEHRPVHPRFQNYDTHRPSIVAEFATRLPLRHSMLTETIDRLDPTYASSEIG